MLIVSSLKRLVRLHPRLLLAIVIGLLIGFSLGEQYRPVECAVIGWNCGVWLYLAMIWILMMRSDGDQVQEFAEQEDESATMVLILVCVAATASLAAIILQLATAKNLNEGAKLLHYAFTVATILGSWFLVGTIFAVHYAKLYYTSAEGALPLKFPEDACQPHYWDFMYFSFTISAAAQTSDIAVVQTAMRKVVLAQSILAFLFNAAILGLSINIAASLVGN